MKKFAILACAFALAMGLAACSGGAASGSASGSAAASDSAAASAAAAEGAEAAADSNLTDFGWIAFEMPEGWADQKESDSYVTIADESNSKHIMKISANTLMSTYPTAADFAAKELASSDSYTDEGTVTVGDYEWSLVGFTFNGNPSVKAYTGITEDKAIGVTIYEMDIDDPAVQTVLTTFVINEDEL